MASKGDLTNVSVVSKVISEFTLQDESLFQVEVDKTYTTANDARYNSLNRMMDGAVIDSSPGTTGNCSIGFSAIDSSSIL